jgi:hypothetical protein
MKTTRAGDRSMMLRLALVGIVAALGVTLPSQNECDNWLINTEKCASSFFANWDTWRPRERIVQGGPDATPEHECEQCRLARLEFAREEVKEAGSTAIASAKIVPSVVVAIAENPADLPHDVSPAPVASPMPIAIEPVAVSGDHAADFAFEFNWNAEEARVAQSPAPLAASQARLEWAALGEKLEPRLVSDLWGPLGEGVAKEWHNAVVAGPSEDAEPLPADVFIAAEGDDDDQPRAPETAAPLLKEVAPLEAEMVEDAPADVYGPELFEAVACEMNQWESGESEPACNWAASCPVIAERPKVAVNPESNDSGTKAAAVAADVIAKAPATVVADDPAAALPWPVFSAVEKAEPTATEVVQAIGVPWPVFAPAAATLEPATASAVKPRPVALEVGRPLPPSEASSASRSAQPDKQSPSSGPPALAQAVRLTQQAMFAWVDVLTGPARVEVTAR